MDKRGQKRLLFFATVVVEAPYGAETMRSLISRPSRELLQCLDLIVSTFSREAPWPVPGEHPSAKLLALAYGMLQSQDPIFTLVGRSLVWAEERRVVQWHAIKQRGICPRCGKDLISEQEPCQCLK